nr:hypothetical protein [Tanacetum cinerariifolium]GFA54176.1 hypothetical protein [Tanacetum cinerariifolium]
MIRNQPLILTKWTPNLALSKNEVTKVHVWVKIHKVPVVAYSEDRLSLIATQIGKPILLDAFTSSMCKDPWGRIGYSCALILPANKKKKGIKVDNRKPRHIEGLKLNKPKPNYVWNVKSTQPSKSKLDSDEGTNTVKLNNHFNVLQDHDDDFTVKDVRESSRGKNEDKCVNNSEPTPMDSDSEVFQCWEWTSNASLCSKDCRIILGCDKDIVRQLWADLDLHKNEVRGSPWILMGDFNVIDDERFLKQKAKIQWLEIDDSNSAYFCKTVKSSKQRSRIDVIKTNVNVEVNGTSVLEVFVSYHESFLGTSMTCADLDTTGLFIKRVSDNSNSTMTCQVTNEGIKKVMFVIGDDKSLGPDEYTSTFFKKG